MKNNTLKKIKFSFILFCLLSFLNTHKLFSQPICDSHFSHYSSSNPDSVHFYPNSTSATFYHWDFGDGTTSNLPLPWHQYLSPGDYYACLTVYDTSASGPCTSTTCDSIHIANLHCDAHFAFYSISNPDSIHFYPTGPTASHYFWNFGDGTSSTDQFPWHEFPHPGVYFTCLTIYDSTAAGTCTATFCDSIHINPIHCDAHFSYYFNNTTINPDSVHFYPTGPTASHYFWDFGDGTQSTELNPWHHYTSPGVYFACLTVYDSTTSGICTSQWCDSIHFGNPNCDAHFSHYIINNPDSLHFYPTGASATNYHWDFGDGTTSNLQYPWHFYTAPGNYFVCLTVYDTTTTPICTSHWCDSVRIVGSHCDAHFSHYSISNPDSIHFYPTGTTATHYHWDFGDGTSSNLQLPWHFFSMPGNYLVCLTVYDSTSAGICTATWCDTVRIVNINCSGHFSFYQLLNPDSVHFYPTGPTATSYYWHFSDGTYSTSQYPWHVFSLPGAYYVCLTVRDSSSNGICIDTWCDSVHIAPFNLIDESISNQASFTIYPNPAHKNLTLKINSVLVPKTIEVQIEDLNGRIIYRNKISSNEYMFNIENYKAGIYIIRLKIDDKFYYKKLVID